LRLAPKTTSLGLELVVFVHVAEVNWPIANSRDALRRVPPVHWGAPGRCRVCVCTGQTAPRPRTAALPVFLPPSLARSLFLHELTLATKISRSGDGLCVSRVSGTTADVQGMRMHRPDCAPTSDRLAAGFPPRVPRPAATVYSARGERAGGGAGAKAYAPSGLVGPTRGRAFTPIAQRRPLVPCHISLKKRPNMPPKRGYMLKHLILFGEGCVCSSGLSTLADTR
jgi:hypothetical protein